MTYLRLFWGIFIFAKELCTFGNAEISCQGVLAGAVWGEDLHDSLDRCFLVGFSCTSFKPYGRFAGESMFSTQNQLVIILFVPTVSNESWWISIQEMIPPTSLARLQYPSWHLHCPREPARVACLRPRAGRSQWTRRWESLVQTVSDAELNHIYRGGFGSL